MSVHDLRLLGPVDSSRVGFVDGSGSAVASFWFLGGRSQELALRGGHRRSFWDRSRPARVAQKGRYAPCTNTTATGFHTIAA